MAAAEMNPWPITAPGPNDLNFAVVAYGFTDSLANDLAELPSDLDAIDLTLLDLASSVVDQTILIASMFDGLDDLLSVIGEIDASPLDPVLADLANTAAAGDATLSDYQDQLGDSSGSGGGGTPTPVSSCATQDFGDVQQGTVSSIKINISNNSPNPILIKGIVIVGVNVGNIFTISNTYQNTSLPSGSSLPLTIAADASSASPQEYTSTLTIDTDQPDPQQCMTLKANVTPGAPGPPSGGGGGPGGGSGPCDVGFDERGHLGCID